MNDSYKNGFMDACASAGIDRPLATELYKEAGLFGMLGKGLSWLDKPISGTARVLWRGATGVGRGASWTAQQAGKIPGKAIGGWGKFTGKHPVLGFMAVAAPAAGLTQYYANDNAKKMTANTFTPEQQRMYERSIGMSGRGVRGSEFSSGGYL